MSIAEILDNFWEADHHVHRERDEPARQAVQQLKNMYTPTSLRTLLGNSM